MRCMSSISMSMPIGGLPCQRCKIQLPLRPMPSQPTRQRVSSMSLSDAEHLLCLALLVLLLVSVSRLSSMFLSSTIRPLASKTAFRLYLTISCLLAALLLGVCFSLLEIPLPEPSPPSGELTSPYRAQDAKPRPDYEHILRKPDK